MLDLKNFDSFTLSFFYFFFFFRFRDLISSQYWMSSCITRSLFDPRFLRWSCPASSYGATLVRSLFLSCSRIAPVDHLSTWSAHDSLQLGHRVHYCLFFFFLFVFLFVFRCFTQLISIHSTCARLRLILAPLFIQFHFFAFVCPKTARSVNFRLNHTHRVKSLRISIQARIMLSNSTADRNLISWATFSFALNYTNPILIHFSIRSFATDHHQHHHHRAIKTNAFLPNFCLVPPTPSLLITSFWQNPFDFSVSLFIIHIVCVITRCSQRIKLESFVRLIFSSFLLFFFVATYSRSFERRFFKMFSIRHFDSNDF